MAPSRACVRPHKVVITYLVTRISKFRVGTSSWQENASSDNISYVIASSKPLGFGNLLIFVQ